MNNTLYSSTMKTALVSYEFVFFEKGKHFNECWENQIEIRSPHKQAAALILPLSAFNIEQKTKSCAFSRDEIHVWRLTSRYSLDENIFFQKKKAEKKSSTCRNIRIPKLEKLANIVIDVIVCTLFVRKGTVSFIFQLISSIWTIFFLESFRRFNQMFQLSNVVLCKFVPYYSRYNFVGWKLVSVCLTLHVYLKMRKKIDLCIVHYRTMFKKT